MVQNIRRFDVWELEGTLSEGCGSPDYGELEYGAVDTYTHDLHITNGDVDNRVTEPRQQNDELDGEFVFT